MRALKNATIASALGLALAVAALPAAAQSTDTGKPANTTTGKLPDDSLAGQRQGAIGGGSVSQGDAQSGSSSAPAAGTSGSSGAAGGSAASGSSGTTMTPPTTGGSNNALPDNSLAGQRQGAIGGGSVTQGGSGSTDAPKQ